MAKRYTHYDATGPAELIAHGHVSWSDLFDAALARTSQVDPNQRQSTRLLVENHCCGEPDRLHATTTWIQLESNASLSEKRTAQAEHLESRSPR